MLKKGFAQSKAWGEPQTLILKGKGYHWIGLTARIHEVFSKKLIFAQSIPVLTHILYYKLYQSVYPANG